jgi:hypothetical protein
MPDPIAAAPAAPAPAPAAPAAPTPAPAVPTIPPMRARPTVSASKALGADDNKAVLEGAQKRLTGSLPPVTGAPKPAPAPEPPKPAPAAPPKPADPAPAPAPAEPPKPAKIKVGGKEYTEEELASLLEKQNTPPAPAPAPAEPPKPAEPTEEQVKAATAQYKAEVAKSFDISEEQINAFLGGGPEAVQAARDLLAESFVKVRQSIFAEVNEGLIPGLQRMQGDLTVLMQGHQQIAQYETEQVFLKQHPEFAQHVDRARDVAKLLLETYPEQCRKMTREQFIGEVARQTDNILTAEYKHWYPTATGTWRDLNKAAAAPAAPAPAPAGTPAATPNGATPPAAPPPVAPPAANPPAAAPTAPAANWHKSTAASLRD